MKKHLWIPQVICTIMLLWALCPHNPYSYYVLLRWVCCGVFAYLALRSLERDKAGWVWGLGIAALFYNPLLPVHLNRELWSVINVVTAGFLVASILALRERNSENNNDLTSSSESDLNPPPNDFSDNHIVIQCENCGQKLRFPAKKERLRITCPACQNVFYFQNGKGT